jgi:hypothetical protein
MLFLSTETLSPAEKGDELPFHVREMFLFFGERFSLYEWHSHRGGKKYFVLRARRVRMAP